MAFNRYIVPNNFSFPHTCANEIVDLHCTSSSRRMLHGRCQRHEEKLRNAMGCEANATRMLPGRCQRVVMHREVRNLEASRSGCPLADVNEPRTGPRG